MGIQNSNVSLDRVVTKEADAQAELEGAVRAAIGETTNRLLRKGVKVSAADLIGVLEVVKSGILSNLQAKLSAEREHELREIQDFWEKNQGSLLLKKKN